MNYTVISREKLDFLKEFGCDVSEFVVEEEDDKSSSSYECEYCHSAYIYDEATADFICSKCGHCEQDLWAGCTQEFNYKNTNGLLPKAKQYEPTKYVWEKLSGVKFAPLHVEDLARGYTRVIWIWNRIKPPTRKAQLNVNFVMRKLCAMLGYEHYIPQIPDIKTNKTKKQLEQYWEGVLKEWGNQTTCQQCQPSTHSAPNSSPSTSRT